MHHTGVFLNIFLYLQYLGGSTERQNVGDYIRKYISSCEPLKANICISVHVTKKSNILGAIISPHACNILTFISYFMYKHAF